MPLRVNYGDHAAAFAATMSLPADVVPLVVRAAMELESLKRIENLFGQVVHRANAAAATGFKPEEIAQVIPFAQRHADVLRCAAGAAVAMIAAMQAEYDDLTD